MNAPGPVGKVWTRRRWATWIGLAFVFQLAFIHALSLHRPVTPRAALASEITVPRMIEPTLRVWSELRNPTLLSLGDAHGFQTIWMATTPPPPLDATARDELAWLEVNEARLGEGFRAFAATHRAALHGLVYKPAPMPSLIDVPIRVAPLRTASVFRVEGPLSQRPLLVFPELRSWAAADVLTSSRVQITVDALGRVVSALLLPPGCGLAEADRFAVDQSHRLRFARDRSVGRDDVAVGRVVFEWHSLPLTNAPAEVP